MTMVKTEERSLGRHARRRMHCLPQTAYATTTARLPTSIANGSFCNFLAALQRCILPLALGAAPKLEPAFVRKTILAFMPAMTQCHEFHLTHAHTHLGNAPIGAIGDSCAFALADVADVATVHHKRMSFGPGTSRSNPFTSAEHPVPPRGFIGAAAPSTPHHAQHQCGGSSSAGCGRGLHRSRTSVGDAPVGRVMAAAAPRGQRSASSLSARVAAASIASVACGLRLGQAPC